MGSEGRPHRHILITGGSRGIGASTAILAGNRGWSVALNYLHDDVAADATAAEVRRRGGATKLLKGDVTIEDQVAEMFRGAAETFGPLDGVVVNAGIVAPQSRFADMPASRLKQVLDTNVFGAFLCAREAARLMSTDRGGGGGSIVMVSSAASRLGSPFEYVDYASSKGAIDSLTVGLSKELGPSGVRVNAVRPGLINTSIHAAGGDPGRAQRLGTQTPLGRSGQPAEVAEAIIWLLSPESSYVTGALLDVSGGR